MISPQIINKVLQDKDFSFVERANLTREYFDGYEEEFDFLVNHIKKYNIVPDKSTFIDHFENFELQDIEESEQYLIDKAREEKLYRDAVPIMQKAAELYTQDASIATEYVINKFKNMKPNYNVTGIDIIQQAKKRQEELADKQKNRDNWFFQSGFPELDRITHGIQRKEEFIILFARTSHGKSWVAMKMATAIWEQGFNVGFFSPEMTDNTIGYRFDTLFKHFSNFHLVYGENFNDSDYDKYIKNLPKHKNKFIVTTPLDFDKKATISKLRNWIIENDLHAIFIDGISYLSDERYKRGDNTTTSLTNLAEDLMSLSVEMHVPVIGVVQANREAAGEDKTAAPPLETIRNSDGLAHNASKVYSMRIKDGTLELNIQKHRNGKVGNRLLYNWNINTGKFTYLPNPKSGLPEDEEKQNVEKIKNEFNDLESVF